MVHIVASFTRLWVHYIKFHILFFLALSFEDDFLLSSQEAAAGFLSIRKTHSDLNFQMTLYHHNK